MTAGPPVVCIYVISALLKGNIQEETHQTVQEYRWNTGDNADDGEGDTKILKADLDLAATEA